MNNIAILGYGNIGHAAEQALKNSIDLTFTGIYHHSDFSSLLADAKAGKIDGVILSTPTRAVPEYAAELLKVGISTVDSFDIHTRIPQLLSDLMPLAKAGKAVSVIAAGWDPGSDSVVRCLMQALAPQGITFTNFGPGRSMGHTVAAKAVEGVEDALSMTIPLGTGIHRRMLYVKLKAGADAKQVEQTLLKDDYFAHDETHVVFVDDIRSLNNVAHGVNLVRNGVSADVHNQRLEFNMTINNPALTGQVLVSAARAALRLKAEQRYGAYTMIEIPPVYLLEGETEKWVKTLV